MKGAILNFDAYTIRVFLHVLGASVWVGGQIVLAALVPTVRQFGDENTKKVANAFNRVAWPFFALTVITGIWHVFAIDLSARSNSYQVGLMLKLLIVAISGVSAYVHTVSVRKSMIAFWGAIGAIGSLAAVFMGAVLLNSF